MGCVGLGEWSRQVHGDLWSRKKRKGGVVVVELVVEIEVLVECGG